jgi:hypothetical protein
MFKTTNNYSQGRTSWGNNRRNSGNTRNGYNNRQNRHTHQTKLNIPQVLKTPDISNAKLFPKIASSHMKPTATETNNLPMYSDKYLQSISVTTTNLTPDENTTSNQDNILDQYEERRGWINTQIKKSSIDAVEIDNENAFEVLNGLNELYFSRLFKYVNTYNQNTHGKYLDVESVEHSMCKTFRIETMQCTDNDDDPYYDSEYDE